MLQGLSQPSIALIGPIAPPAGGMAMQTEQLKNLLLSENISVEVFATNAPYSPSFIKNIKGLRAVFRLCYYCVNLWKLCKTTKVLHIMANSGWSWHLFAVPAIVIGKVRKCKVIINYRGGGAKKFLSISSLIVTICNKRSI